MVRPLDIKTPEPQAKDDSSTTSNGNIISLNDFAVTPEPYDIGYECPDGYLLKVKHDVGLTTISCLVEPKGSE